MNEDEKLARRLPLTLYFPARVTNVQPLVPRILRMQRQGLVRIRPLDSVRTRSGCYGEVSLTQLGRTTLMVQS